MSASYDVERRYVRVARILEIQYSVEDTRFEGRVSDIGEGGAFLDTTYPQPVGTDLRFRLELPDDPQPIEGKARVTWQEEMLGMGIAFVGLTKEQKDQLRFFVGSTFFGGAPEG